MVLGSERRGKQRSLILRLWVSAGYSGVLLTRRTDVSSGYKKGPTGCSSPY